MEKRIKLLQNQTVTDYSTENLFFKYSFLVTSFPDANDFLLYMRRNNINFDIYSTSPRSLDDDISLNAHKAIWLGREVDIETVKLVIKKAKEFYPHLKYINLSHDNEPEEGHKQIYIGGSTNSAIEFGCLPMSEKDFEDIQNMDGLDNLHDYIKSFSK